MNFVVYNSNFLYINPTSLVFRRCMMVFLKIGNSSLSSVLNELLLFAHTLSHSSGWVFTPMYWIMALWLVDETWLFGISLLSILSACFTATHPSTDFKYPNQFEQFVRVILLKLLQLLHSLPEFPTLSVHTLFRDFQIDLITQFDCNYSRFTNTDIWHNFYKYIRPILLWKLHWCFSQ